MKKFVIIIIFFLGIGIYLLSQDNKNVKWYTFEEAVELAKKNPKKLFIDVYTDWCGWCKVMDRNTFEHPVISTYLNENFYPVKFNAESTKPVKFSGKTFINEGTGLQRNPHQLAIALLQGQMAYPSVAYMNEDLQLLTAVPGYFTPEELEPIIKFFGENSYKKISYEEFRKNFVSQIK
jgi:thioredoxin-related protein